jgi:GNAT superfamily N-acetyltransferase
VYNNAWVFHENFVPIRKENLEKVLEKSKNFIEERFIWFAYVDGEPAGFLVLFPDVNQILKYMNGKVNLWTMLKFIYYKRKKTITRGRIVIMGVLPKYQKSGIESAIFYNLKNVILPMNIIQN